MAVFNVHRDKPARSQSVFSLSPLGSVLAPWPALSPDLSIIENVWALMSQKLSRMDVCTTAAQLEASLNEIRRSITLDVLHGLFDSIPRRMQDCIRLEGAPVRF